MANIKNYLNDIKNAMFGRDVRGSIHNGIDAINKEVESTTKRQVKLEETQKQLIINAGNSNAEVVASRVKEDGTSFDTIGDRMADSEGKISVFDSRIKDIAINVKNYGAIGNGVTDDTEAIKLAYIEASKINGSLHFPNGVYRTTQTLIFNANVNLKMDGFIQQDFGLNIPIVVFGGDSETVLKGLKCNLKARRNPNENYSYANWEDENNVAIVVKNIQNSEILIDEASYCCVGIKLLGEHAGLSYSSIRFGNIANNKISVLFECDGNKEDGAYVTELSLYNGRITKNSNLNTNKNNYGVVSRITKSQNMIDNIKWYNPCFELNKYGTDEGYENICFDLQYCKDFKVINYRAEKIRSEYLAYLTKCEGVEFIPGGVYDAPRNIKFVELSTWDSKTKLTNRIKGYDKEQELININVSKSMFYERKIYKSDNIKRKILLKPPLLSVNFDYTNSIRDTQDFTYETLDIDRDILTNRGFRLLSNKSNTTNIGVRVITGGHKYFKLETNTCPAIAVLCYDSSGNYLTPSETNKYAYFYYNEISNFNENKVLITKDTTQDDAKTYPQKQKEVEIVITDDTVASFIILVCGNNKNTAYNYLSCLKVKALYLNGEIDKYSNPSVDCNFDCKPFPAQASKPVGLGAWGEIIYNSQPSYGLDIGWVCCKSGDETNSSIWRSIGIVGDN